MTRTEASEVPPIRRWEVFRPSRATVDRAAYGRGAPQEPADAGNAPERSGGQPRAKRSAQRGRKAPRAPPRRPQPSSALTECAGRGMPPPLAEPAYGGGMHGDGPAPDGNLVIAERGGDAARRPPPRRARLRRQSPHTDRQTHNQHYNPQSRTKHAFQYPIRT